MNKVKLFVSKYKTVILAFTGGILAHHGLSEYNHVIEAVINMAGD